MDPKKILGVDEDSSPAEIRIAYRRLARKHHPDIGGNAVDFKQVREAYEILTGKRKSRAAKSKSQKAKNRNSQSGDAPPNSPNHSSEERQYSNASGNSQHSSFRSDHGEKSKPEKAFFNQDGKAKSDGFYSGAKQTQAARRKVPSRVKWLISAVTAVLMLLIFLPVIYFAIRPAVKLRDAIRQRDWDSVLKLDPTNKTALIEIVQAEFSKPEPNLQTIFETLPKIEDRHAKLPDHLGLWAVAYAKRSAINSAEGKITEAVDDFKNAKECGVSKELSAKTEHAIAGAYHSSISNHIAKGKLESSLLIYSKLEQSSGLSNGVGDDCRLIIESAFGKRAQKHSELGDFRSAYLDLTAIKRLNGASPKVVDKIEQLIDSKFLDWARNLAGNSNSTAAKKFFDEAEANNINSVLISNIRTIFADMHLHMAEIEAQTSLLEEMTLNVTKAKEYDPELMVPENIVMAPAMFHLKKFESAPDASLSRLIFKTLEDLETSSSAENSNQLSEIQSRFAVALLSSTILVDELSFGNFESVESKIERALKWIKDYDQVRDSKRTISETLSACFDKLVEDGKFLAAGKASLIILKVDELAVARLEKGLATLPLIENSIGMQFRLCPQFEKPVELTEFSRIVFKERPFFMGVHEVTQDQFAKVMGYNPSRFKGGRHPVDNVCLDEATNFCRKLSILTDENNAGRDYRLPTEQEWTFACKGGCDGEFGFGSKKKKVQDYAWYNSNSTRRTHVVGGLKPNGYGLYDMYGNVWEWCPNTSNTSGRIYGFCWGTLAKDFSRMANYPNGPNFRASDVGFRVLMTMEVVEK